MSLKLLMIILPNSDLFPLGLKDISQNKADISKNRVDISQNSSYITLNRLDIDDISLNKHFIQQLQSVDYRILLGNSPSQIPVPPIQTGYNAVVIYNYSKFWSFI